MNKEYGFTLLEVIVALLIISLLSLSFLQILFFLGKARKNAYFLNTSSLWAQLILEDYNDGNGSFPGGGENMHLSKEKKTLHQGETAKLIILTLTITWEDEGREDSFSLHTLKLEEG